jgi:hypothetical protein
LRKRLFLQLRLDSVRERNGAGKRTAQINQEPAATQMASGYCCVLSDEAANAALRAALPKAAALNRRDPLAFGYEALCGVNLAARHGDQFGIRRFVYRIGNDAGDHSSSNDAEPKFESIA